MKWDTKMDAHGQYNQLLIKVRFMAVLHFHPEEISRPVMHHFLLLSERLKGEKINIIERSSSVIGGLIDGLEA